MIPILVDLRAGKDEGGVQDLQDPQENFRVPGSWPRKGLETEAAAPEQPEFSREEQGPDGLGRVLPENDFISLLD